MLFTCCILIALKSGFMLLTGRKFDSILLFFAIIFSERLDNFIADSSYGRKAESKKVVYQETKVFKEGQPKFLVKLSSTFFQLKQIQEKLQKKIEFLVTKKEEQKSQSQRKKAKLNQIVEETPNVRKDSSSRIQKQYEAPEDQLMTYNTKVTSLGLNNPIDHQKLINKKQFDHKLIDFSQGHYMFQRKKNNFNKKKKIKIPNNIDQSSFLYKFKEDDASKSYVFSVNNNQSVQQCLICFENKPDCVYMNCGHGGICKECAFELWQKKNECYLCRESITKIIQIDTAGLGKYKPIIAMIEKQSFIEVCDDIQDNFVEENIENIIENNDQAP